MSVVGCRSTAAKNTLPMTRASRASGNLTLLQPKLVAQATGIAHAGSEESAHGADLELLLGVETAGFLCAPALLGGVLLRFGLDEPAPPFFAFPLFLSSVGGGGGTSSGGLAMPNNRLNIWRSPRRDYSIACYTRELLRRRRIMLGSRTVPQQQVHRGFILKLPQGCTMTEPRTNAGGPGARPGPSACKSGRAASARLLLGQQPQPSSGFTSQLNPPRRAPCAVSLHELPGARVAVDRAPWRPVLLRRWRPRRSRILF